MGVAVGVLVELGVAVAVFGTLVGAGVLVAGVAEDTENTTAALFQVSSVPQPGVNTPILTVYAPDAAVAGTCQVLE